MAVRRILTVLALAGLTRAQNPWVNRRKNKDKDAPVAADPAAGDTDFSKLNDMVKNLQQAGAAGGQGEDMFAGMGDMWESLMDSPEMEEMLANPELLKATIKNNPLINAIPGASEQVEALLQSDAFNDPAQLKQAPQRLFARVAPQHQVRQIRQVHHCVGQLFDLVRGQPDALQFGHVPKTHRYFREPVPVNFQRRQGPHEVYFLR